VYVCDRYNYRIQEFDADGNFITQWGGYGNAPGQYDFLYCMDVGPDGSIYVTDQFNHRVDKYRTEPMPPLRTLQKISNKPWVIETEDSIKPWAERATDYGAPGVGKRP
jgi:DNA-binding beta-propeller fold protein YncE